MDDQPRIQVLLFGAVADLIGLRELEMEISYRSSLNEIIERFSTNYPKLSEHKLLTAVNEEYASDPDRLLNAGDRVAIFTAVSGG